MQQKPKNLEVVVDPGITDGRLAAPSPKEAQMSDLENPSTELSERSSKLRPIIAVALLAVALLAVAVWFLFIRDTSADSVTTAAADEARQEALAEADEPAEAQDPVVGETDDPLDAVGVDGTWTVDTTIGTFDDSCLTDVCDTSFVGFRIDEELASVGAKTVVGRSPGVVGSIEIEGTTILAAEIAVDMTQLITDSNNRTNAIRSQAIETNDFPEASFRLSEPIELGAIPAEGESVERSATGELTIHGVTNTESVDLTAELVGDVIVVFGELGPILLADYEIDKPSAAVVVSVEDNALMELQLFFTR